MQSMRDIAAAVRGRRLDLGLSQADLASRARVSRKWISEFESGKATAELGLTLRVLDALGLRLEIAASAGADIAEGQSTVDLDNLLEQLRTRPRGPSNR
jgi:HTH-type transcriptional regulator/antitoxin HipB